MHRTSLAPLSGLFFLISAAFLWAQQAQDWIPAELSLPGDMEVTVDRAIGSSTRIFAFVTGEDTAALLDRWSEALSEAGYVLKSQPDSIEARQIEFSGPGIGNAKIAVQPIAEAGRNVVQFDASLR